MRNLKITQLSLLFLNLLFCSLLLPFISYSANYSHGTCARRPMPPLTARCSSDSLRRSLAPSVGPGLLAGRPPWLKTIGPICGHFGPFGQPVRPKILEGVKWIETCHSNKVCGTKTTNDEYIEPQAALNDWPWRRISSKLASEGSTSYPNDK